MTPNNSLMRDLVREFAAQDPTLSALFDQSSHNAWPYSHTSCRKISGSNRWSRHAWGDAGDIMKLNGTPNAKPGEPHYLDIFHDWLVLNADAFDLDNIIYRSPNHWNHIHIDFNHHGTGTPPCAGGSLTTTAPTGGFVLTIEDSGTTPPPGVPPKGDEELTTLELQGALTSAGFEPGDQDGVMGPMTFEAWVQALRGGWSGVD